MASILENRGVGVLWLIFAWFQLSNGALYKVGDSAGWTTIGKVDYKQWAVTKTFQVGDIIVFEYNPQFHNVMQVIHSQYKACSVSSPISTHTTGNDSITIKTYGHHFFVCGVPGHCQSGQKVDINVLRASSLAPIGSGTPPPAPAAAVPSPSSSDAAPPVALPAPFLKFKWLLPIFQLLLVFYFNGK